MTELAEAIRQVDQVARRVVNAYCRAGMSSAVHHSLVGAVMAGARFETEADVRRWLDKHTGLQALEVTRR